MEPTVAAVISVAVILAVYVVLDWFYSVFVAKVRAARQRRKANRVYRDSTNEYPDDVGPDLYVDAVVQRDEQGGESLEPPRESYEGLHIIEEATEGDQARAEVHGGEEPTARDKTVHDQTVFGFTPQQHIENVIGWIDTNRMRLPNPICSVRANSARCDCGLHMALTDLRAAKNHIEEMKKE